MKPSPSDTEHSQPKMRSGEQARVGIIILVLTSFLLGLAASGVWHFWHAPKQREAWADDEGLHELSDSTKTVLKGLNSSVEIRFYSLLDASSVSQSMQAFAGRVDRLLSDYQQEADGKITVKHFKSTSTDADGASVDGIKPFNMDKGDACYLGLAIACNDQKESLAQLSPQWEAALESDLTRAIERMAAPKPTAEKPQIEPTISADALEEVKRFFPNLADVSLENGTRMLRDAALTELQTAMKEAQPRTEEAKQRLVQASNSGSETERQAALKQLQQTQIEQTEKFNEIGTRTQARIAALEKLKGETR